MFTVGDVVLIEFYTAVWVDAVMFSDWLAAVC